MRRSPGHSHPQLTLFDRHMIQNTKDPPETELPFRLWWFKQGHQGTIYKWVTFSMCPLEKRDGFKLSVAGIQTEILLPEI